jgi:hypothetical protein
MMYICVSLYYFIFSLKTVWLPAYFSGTVLEIEGTSRDGETPGMYCQCTCTINNTNLLHKMWISKFSWKLRPFYTVLCIVNKSEFKGTIQRNLRWVQSNINRFVSLWAVVASLCFRQKYSRHLEIHKKQFSTR